MNRDVRLIIKSDKCRMPVVRTKFTRETWFEIPEAETGVNHRTMGYDLCSLVGAEISLRDRKDAFTFTVYVFERRSHRVSWNPRFRYRSYRFIRVLSICVSRYLLDLRTRNQSNHEVRKRTVVACQFLVNWSGWSLKRSKSWLSTTRWKNVSSYLKRSSRECKLDW